MIPDLVPDLISGERILNFVQVGFECRNGFGVVSDFGVSVISVVDHVSCDRFLYIHSDLVQLLVASKHDIIDIVWVEIVVVESDVNHLLSETVHAQLIDGLLDSERLNFGVLVILNDAFKRVNSSCFKPGVGPFLNFEVGTHLLVLSLVVSFLKYPDEIIKDGVLPSIFVEISVERCSELRSSNNKMKLLEERCSLSVGNTIKDTLCLLQRRDFATNWVSGLQLISRDTSELRLLEVKPSLASESDELWCLGQSKERHISGKRLVQPEVIEPFHGNKITEPHMRQLMESGGHLHKPLSQSNRLATIQSNLIIGDTSYVFHTARVGLRGKDLIVFVEWVWSTEEVVVIFHACHCYLKYLFMVDGGKNRLSSINTHWWDKLIVGLILVLKVPVWTSNHSINISGNLRRLWEHLHLVVVTFQWLTKRLGNLHKFVLDLRRLLLIWSVFSLVADHVPIIWNERRESPCCSQVWLIKDRHHIVAVFGLQMGVQILLVIGGVDEAV